jgi:serine/threonine protein kinase
MAFSRFLFVMQVIAYILLCGFAPFAGATDLETIHLVQTASLEFPSPEWDIISDAAKDFIQSLLQRDPLKRPTAAMALKHPWVAKHVVEPGVPIPRPFTRSRTRSSENKSIGEDVENTFEDVEDDSKRITSDLRWDSTRRTAFQKFLASLKVHKAIVGATQILTPQEASYLGQVFHKVDRDQDGKISVTELEHAVSSPNFSSSVKENLKQMKSHLAAHPQLSLDIRPFLGFLDRRAKSASTVEEEE